MLTVEHVRRVTWGTHLTGSGLLATSAWANIRLTAISALIAPPAVSRPLLPVPPSAARVTQALRVSQAIRVRSAQRGLNQMTHKVHVKAVALESTVMEACARAAPREVKSVWMEANASHAKSSGPICTALMICLRPENPVINAQQVMNQRQTAPRAVAAQRQAAHSSLPQVSSAFGATREASPTKS